MHHASPLALSRYYWYFAPADRRPCCRSKVAAFLGDPNFPELAIRASESGRATSRGEKILYFQDLYMKYSRLAFTNWEDRAVAMAGLEQRLVAGFRSRGGFGILDDTPGLSHRSLLHRSLLWRRGRDEPALTRIAFPSDRQKAPSWSWMAHRGAIDYLPLPFAGVEWELVEVRSPWGGGSAAAGVAVGAKARPLQGAAAADRDAHLAYDAADGATAAVGLLCVVMGRAKGSAPAADRAHYVLLVAPAPAAPPPVASAPAYERVGAGSLPGRCIEFGRPGLDISIR